MTPQRFIPAHAGNTCVLRGVLNPFSVHPRARGEHHGVRENLYRDAGSSPRTRGTPLQLDHNDFQTRFIPAHAGNTTRHSTRTPACTVHPRARGEHNRVNVIFWSADGSSPRTRGTRDEHLADRFLGRFIPAHAGNTLPIISLCYKDLEERELSTELPEGKDPFSGVVKEPLV